MREEEHLVLVTLYDYSVRNFQSRTSTDLDADIPPRDETESMKPRFADRTIIYPPTSKAFQAGNFFSRFPFILVTLNSHFRIWGIMITCHNLRNIVFKVQIFSSY